MAPEAADRDTRSDEAEQGRGVKRPRASPDEDQENAEHMIRIPGPLCNRENAAAQEEQTPNGTEASAVLQGNRALPAVFAKSSLPTSAPPLEKPLERQAEIGPSSEQGLDKADVISAIRRSTWPGNAAQDASHGQGSADQPTSQQTAACAANDAKAHAALTGIGSPLVLTVSQAAATIAAMQLPAFQAEGEAATLQGTGPSEATGPSQPQPESAAAPQEAPEEEYFAPSAETLAAIDEQYHLKTPYVVHPEAARAGHERQQKYRERVVQLKAAKQAKEDMVANKELKGPLKTPVETIGHIPGVKIGETFRNKGELSIMGIHCNITGGIYFKGPNPAFSIVASGGYTDDHDAGEYIDYTGMGGQDKDGKQIKDQQWEKGNMALRRSCLQGTPVRVVRGANLEKTYDGLYRIVRAWRERGKDNFLVCRFKMMPIPGHSKLSAPVVNRARHSKRAFDRVEFAAKRRTWAFAIKDRLERPAEWVKFRIKEDITGGLENVEIPLVNEMGGPAPELELQYIRESVIDSPAAQKRADDARAAYEHKACGWRKAGFCAYDDQGLVSKGYANHPCFAECPESCGADDERCQRNRVVSRGITLPLEVFWTGPERKWGLRCAHGILEGAFICDYTGVVISDEEADKLDSSLDHDKYLYDMSDFVRENALPDASDSGFRPPMPRDPADPTLIIENCLTIDARRKGNVARFMNHSCDGGNNVFPRPVLVEGSTGLLYKVAFFARKYIKPGVELTYDYHWTEQHFKGGCHCGAPKCRAPSAAGAEAGAGAV